MKTALANAIALPALSPRVQVYATAALLVVASVLPAYAQDTIGVTPIATAMIYVFKALAVAAIGFCAIQAMAGRHRTEAVIGVVLGGLALAKIDAIASLFGLS